MKAVTHQKENTQYEHHTSLYWEITLRNNNQKEATTMTSERTHNTNINNKQTRPTIQNRYNLKLT